MQVDVIIPTYRAGKRVWRVNMQASKAEYPIHRIIIINTEVGEFPTEC